MDAWFLVILGLAGLIAGGEMLVRGSVSVARSLGISPMVIGLTLIGFGTSTPELLTSLQAALAGSPGIAMGNVVGSNTGNILLILGLTALLAPVSVNPKAFYRDSSVLVLATTLCWIVVWAGEITRAIGVGFLVCLAGYLIFTVRSEKQPLKSPAKGVYEAEADLVDAPQYSLKISLALAVFGLGITLLGAQFLVSGSISIAQDFGISETVIGLTIVAIGTSMPELVTSLMAVLKRQTDVALGNVLGSNIFNILGILGVTALVEPLIVPADIKSVDIWVMALATALLVFFARSGWRIGRLEGGVMLCGYMGYLTWLLL